MNIEEAIKTAIEYEVRVRELYVEALDEAVEPVAQRLYQLMADEENRHVMFLEAKLSEWVVHQRLTFEGLDTAVPSVESISREVAKLEGALTDEGKKPDKEIVMLNRIKAIELETSAFYRRLTNELPPEGKAFFEQFLVIEEGHVGLVEAEIDALSASGFWFDMPEFNVEHG